ncbi:hypothetical protein HHK36_028077 [Tetracentron sinense]|uniref:E3 ubiquitin-protein ligase RNF25 n=1 Tax=Tetracentron sinense TaxID=13715 RepID=A0A834YIT5_TETSI|nr:hypothetical protein HHK36_028077 [Tetracentron sinense]
MAEEEEVLMEVEALQAVYGDDCLVIEKFPPNFHLHINPRTADDSSQQFVEAVIGVRACPQYPEEPPHLEIIGSKGLDGHRKKHLITRIQEKAHELSSCLMLVALCEEAVETLSNMNHPDGNCPLCLYPLVLEDKQNSFLPFMKLMSCFHCFHSECIIRWWKWLQEQKEINPNTSSYDTVCPSRDLENQREMHGTMKANMGNCPVCRMIFHTEDIEHVLNLVGTHSFQLNLEETEASSDEALLQSDSENIRRQKFETLLKLQQENSGLIEPKSIEVLLPGTFLPESITIPTVSVKATNKQQQGDPTSTLASETDSSGSSNKPSTSKPKNSGMRKYRAQNSRKQLKQWIKKENSATE